MSPRRAIVRGDKACQFCNRIFRKTEHLQRHERQHTKERPFECPICGNRFGRQDSLGRHLKSHGQTDTVPPSYGRRSTTQETAAILPESVLLELSNGVNHETVPNHETTDTTSQSPFFLVSQKAVPERSYSTFPLQQESEEQDQSMGRLFALSEKSAEATPMPTHGRFDSGTQHDLIFDVDIQELEKFLSGEFSVGTGVSELSPDYLADAWDASIQIVPREVAQKVYKNWFTTFSSSPKDDLLSRPATPVIQATRSASNTYPSSTSSIVNEEYRNSLDRRLQTKDVSSTTLPSAQFLDNCYKIFFKKFYPIFPVLHKPSFVASPGNKYVILSMCSLGAVLMGSEGALKQGQIIYSRLNKIILMTWEKSLMKTTQPEDMAVTQAALLGQTWGYLSDDTAHLATSEAFHGTVLSFARRCSLYKQLGHGLPANNSMSTSDEVWRNWIKIEEMKRVMIGLYIHDAEFSSLFHYEPYLDPQLSTLKLPCHSSVFEAPTSTKWLEYLQLRPELEFQVRDFFAVDEDSSGAIDSALVGDNFCLYLILENINSLLARLWSKNTTSLFKADHRQIQTLLCRWYRLYIRSAFAVDHFHMLVLWHTIFMNSLVNLKVVEAAVGKDGQGPAMQAAHLLRTSLDSQDCSRAVFHASLVQSSVNKMSLADTPPIHTPRCLFQATLIIFVLSNLEASASPIFGDWEELALLEMESQEVYSTVLALESIDRHSIRRAADVLRRLGYWQISRRLAHILDVVASEEF